MAEDTKELTQLLMQNAKLIELMAKRICDTHASPLPAEIAQLTSYTDQFKKECEQFNVKSQSEDQSNSSLSIGGLQSSTDDNPRIRHLNKRDQDQHATRDALLTECNRLQSSKQDSSVVQDNSKLIHATQTHPAGFGPKDNKIGSSPERLGSHGHPDAPSAGLGPLKINPGLGSAGLGSHPNNRGSRSVGLGPREQSVFCTAGTQQRQSSPSMVHNFQFRPKRDKAPYTKRSRSSQKWRERKRKCPNVFLVSHQQPQHRMHRNAGQPKIRLWGRKVKQRLFPYFKRTRKKRILKMLHPVIKANCQRSSERVKIHTFHKGRC